MHNSGLSKSSIQFTLNPNITVTNNRKKNPVKIKKPEDEKYFKDIVLRDILEEISNEEGIAIHTPQIKRPSKKKLFSKNILFITISIIFLFFMITLFKLVTDVTTEEKPISQTSETLITDTQEWKMEEDKADDKKIVAPKAVQETHISKKAVQNKTIEIKAVKPKPVTKQKTEREREIAKEILRQQMLN